MSLENRTNQRIHQCGPSDPGFSRTLCLLRCAALKIGFMPKSSKSQRVDSQASPARWCSMTNIKTWWDNMWRDKRAQRADWALSSLFTRVTKIPVIQACSLRRKTLKSQKKPLNFDIHNLLRITRWPKKSIHIKNNIFEKTSSSSWSKVCAHQNLARCGVSHLPSIQKISHWQT